MYTQTQLEAIRIFGRKDLISWCYTLEKNWTMWHCWNWEWKICYTKQWDWWYSSSYWDHMWEILWHEPHLEDVFSLMTQKMFYWSYRKVYEIEWYSFDEWWEIDVWDSSIFWHIPYNPTIPLLKQSESTLQQLISLFK